MVACCTGTLEQELEALFLFCSRQDRHTESVQSRTGKSVSATAHSWQNKSVDQEKSRRELLILASVFPCNTQPSRVEVRTPPRLPSRPEKRLQPSPLRWVTWYLSHPSLEQRHLRTRYNLTRTYWSLTTQVLLLSWIRDLISRLLMHTNNIFLSFPIPY